MGAAIEKHPLVAIITLSLALLFGQYGVAQLVVPATTEAPAAQTARTPNAPCRCAPEPAAGGDAYPVARGVLKARVPIPLGTSGRLVLVGENQVDFDDTAVLELDDVPVLKCLRDTRASARGPGRAGDAKVGQ